MQFFIYMYSVLSLYLILIKLNCSSHRVSSLEQKERSEFPRLSIWRSPYVLKCSGSTGKRRTFREAAKSITNTRDEISKESKEERDNKGVKRERAAASGDPLFEPIVITLGSFLRWFQRRRELRGDADDQGHGLLFGIGRVATAGRL